MQPPSITRQCGAAAAAVVAAVVLVHAAPAGGPWRAAPAYVSLFTPAADRAAYEAFVTSRPLDQVLRALQGDPLLVHPPGAWEPTSVIAADAFGASGPYDQSRLARLYGATRVQVARGPRGPHGVVTESWSMFSPYPDPSFRTLQPGTLLIVLRVPDL